jgi:hypothetical protein
LEDGQEVSLPDPSFFLSFFFFFFVNPLLHKVNCEEELPVACAIIPSNTSSSSPPFLLTEWTITSNSVSWTEAEATCEALGLTFAIPSNPYSNRKLKDAILNSNLNSSSSSSSGVLPWIWLNEQIQETAPASDLF